MGIGNKRMSGARLFRAREDVTFRIYNAMARYCARDAKDIKERGMNEVGMFG